MGHSRFGYVPFYGKAIELDNGYINRRRALLSLLHGKSHTIAFIQGTKTVGIDAGMMNKYIGAIFLLDKTVAFFVIEPFHSAVSHSDLLLLS